MVKIILQVAQIVNTEQLQQYIYIYIMCVCVCVCVCARGFESRRGHGYMSVMNIVCCQVEVPATG